jgi:hypothetical protein
MARHRQWHISGWPAVLLTPLVIPVIVAIKLAERLGLKTSADLTARDVESYLSDFLEGKGETWDWDDFTSIPITDPTLEQIRQEAAQTSYPLTDDDEVALRRLLERVKAL